MRSRYEIQRRTYRKPVFLPQENTLPQPVKKVSFRDRFYKKLARFELILGILAFPIVGFVGVNEIQSLAEQRLVNAWQLVTIKAEGNSGKITALQFLNQDHYCIPWTNYCLLEKESLMGINLVGEYLRGANLRGANLTRANLSRADLSYAELPRANLTRANLINTNLTGVNLTGANLTEANLSGVNLFYADLSGANLSGANLTRANLIRANLNGVDLTASFFMNTNLSVERLRLACVRDARLQPIVHGRSAFKDIQLKLCAKND